MNFGDKLEAWISVQGKPIQESIRNHMDSIPHIGSLYDQTMEGNRFKNSASLCVITTDVCFMITHLMVGGSTLLGFMIDDNKVTSFYAPMNKIPDELKLIFKEAPFAHDDVQTAIFCERYSKCNSCGKLTYSGSTECPEMK